MIVQLLTLCGCGVLPIGLFVPAFLVMASILADHVSDIGGIAIAVAPVVAIAWVVLTERLLNRRDPRGRIAVDIGTAALIILALMGFIAAGAHEYSWLALLSAAPSLALQAAASMLLRSDSAKAWFNGTATETPQTKSEAAE
ncbi:hypothetical protein [Glycomyces paridis]|uniref:Uncharacterized protein n=1 Tax=Glycomyces paridis TaxID=2126555 RepID=A0A4S8PD54_9ACTN|nr:hypothetical protein [Glycomyces paridis]THV28303.1 hypothetical protein E9998_11855 [Glycomyces paridis]